MTDEKGVLNPGLMPQTLDDLHRVAPARVEVDDQVVARWNRIADIWRTDVEFRESVLRYATSNAHRDPASAELWPEVVYPLIERARWHRRSRGGAEALWDNLCARLLHIPDAGVRLDRAIRAAVPAQVVEKLDLPPDAFEDEPQLGADAADAPDPSADRLSASLDGSVSLDDLAAEAVPAEAVPAQAVPEAAPAPTPAAVVTASDDAPGDDLERLRRGWTSVVTTITERNRAVKPLITACRPIGVEGAIVTLGFPEEQGFLKDVADRRRPLLEECIGAFLGRDVGVRCVATNLDLIPALPDDQEAAHILAEAHRIFAEDRLDVPEVT
jgi:hypothetical protein